jgi:hypothetical protein
MPSSSNLFCDGIVFDVSNYLFEEEQLDQVEFIAAIASGCLALWWRDKCECACIVWEKH